MAYLKLLNAATATNGAPSGATAGLSLKKGENPGRDWSEGFDLANLGDAVLLLKSTAGSGTMTVTVKLWGWSNLSAEWHPLGTHTVDASRGLLNEATAIGEVVADKLQFAQVISGVCNFDRLYLEITAIGGTSTAVSAWLEAR